MVEPSQSINAALQPIDAVQSTTYKSPTPLPPRASWLPPLLNFICFDVESNSPTSNAQEPHALGCIIFTTAGPAVTSSLPHPRELQSLGISIPVMEVVGQTGKLNVSLKRELFTKGFVCVTVARLISVSTTVTFSDQPAGMSGTQAVEISVPLVETISTLSEAHAGTAVCGVEPRAFASFPGVYLVGIFSESQHIAYMYNSTAIAILDAKEENSNADRQTERHTRCVERVGRRSGIGRAPIDIAIANIAIPHKPASQYNNGIAIREHNTGMKRERGRKPVKREERSRQHPYRCAQATTTPALTYLAQTIDEK